MATIRGKWRWNDGIENAPIPTRDITEEVLFVSGKYYGDGLDTYEKVNIIRMSGALDALVWGISYTYVGSSNGVAFLYSTLYSGELSMNTNENLRIMDFGETDQEVSAEFYNFLVANATPVLTIAEQLTLIDENQQKVFDAGYDEGFAAGKQAEYDAFWDDFQDHGNRIDYARALAGAGWTQEILENIKYPVTFIAEKYSYQCMTKGIFSYLNYGRKAPMDMTNILSKFDFSNCQRASETFANAYVKNITLDLSNCDSLDRIFTCSDAGGKTCENVTLKVSAKCTKYPQTFYYCSGLTELRFMEGSVIAANIEFAQSKNLTRASIESIVNALSTETRGLTVTFSLEAVNKAFNTDDVSLSLEWNELIKDKHWIFNLI
jgi:hypothetical protein